MIGCLLMLLLVVSVLFVCLFVVCFCRCVSSFVFHTLGRFDDCELFAAPRLIAGC